MQDKMNNDNSGSNNDNVIHSEDNNNNSVFCDVSDEQLDFLLQECEIGLPFCMDHEDEENNATTCVSGHHQRYNHHHHHHHHHLNNGNSTNKGRFNENDILCSIEANQLSTGISNIMTSKNEDLFDLCPTPVSSNQLLLSTHNRCASSSSDSDYYTQDSDASSFSDLHTCNSSSVANQNSNNNSSSNNNNNNNNKNGDQGSTTTATAACVNKTTTTTATITDHLSSSSPTTTDSYANCSKLMKAAVKAYKSRQLTPILKEELKLLIQSRRLSEGKEEMEVHFQPPSPSKLNAREVERIERRRAQNRVAAKRCRQKKKTSEESLIQKIKELKEFNMDLVQKLQTLRGEKQQLLDVLVQHSLVCPCFANAPFQQLLDENTSVP